MVFDPSTPCGLKGAGGSSLLRGAPSKLSFWVSRYKGTRATSWFLPHQKKLFLAKVRLVLVLTVPVQISIMSPEK